MNQYLQSGLKGLSKPTTRRQPKLLTHEQEQSFKQVLLTICPQEQGLKGRIWTGNSIKQYLEQIYQVEYKGGIYDLLVRLKLSHQKAHADYANADAQEQKALEGFTKAHIYPDNNPTHKQKMQDFCLQKAKELAVQVVFHYLPGCSPKLNPVEYLIYLVRRQCLHHADHRRNLNEVEKQLTHLMIYFWTGLRQNHPHSAYYLQTCLP